LGLPTPADVLSFAVLQLGFDSLADPWQGAAKICDLSQPGGHCMSTKAERGMKRTCQSPQCGSRFYDLGRDPIACPICGTTYALAGSALAVAAAAPAAEKVARKPAKKPAYAVESVKPEDAPEAEAEDALPAVEGEEEPAAAGEDETFLEEEEEDGSDMTNIIGSPVAEPEEPQ
jgi:uncharacterized protein (TIGR02300 family)